MGTATSRHIALTAGTAGNSLAGNLLTAAELWAWAGGAVALVFLGVGIDRVDPNARTSFVFRPLLIPGIVLLWPLVLWRWAVLETGRDRPHARHQPPRGFHRYAWLVFGAVIPAILIAGLIVRQDGPLERPAILLEAPE
ncbi:MAG: hypothetical protein AAF409_04935 [Pseudomonadota bacterium]